MLQGLGNLLGSQQPGLFGNQTQSPLNLFGQQQNTSPLSGLSGLLSGGLKSTQNKQLNIINNKYLIIIQPIIILKRI